MSSNGTKNWDESLRRLAEEGPERWPAGLRTALDKTAPAAPAGLDARMSAMFQVGAAQQTRKVVSLPFYRRTSFGLAAAASVLLAVGLALVQFWPVEPSEFVVQRKRGAPQLIRDGQSSAVADLRPGDSLVLNDDDALEFSFADGVHLQLLGPARVNLKPAGPEAKNLELNLIRGEIFFVSRNRAAARRFAFTTQRARYELAGTAGLLTAKDEVESIWVVEGAVDLSYPDGNEVLRVPEANYVLVDRDSKTGLPEINATDEHSFQIMCRRRDRLLKLVQSPAPVSHLNDTTTNHSTNPTSNP